MLSSNNQTYVLITLISYLLSLSIVTQCDRLCFRIASLFLWESRFQWRAICLLLSLGLLFDRIRIFSCDDTTNNNCWVLPLDTLLVLRFLLILDLIIRLNTSLATTRISSSIGYKLTLHVDYRFLYITLLIFQFLKL